MQIQAGDFWTVHEGEVVRGGDRKVPLHTRALTHGEGALEVLRTTATGAYLLPRHLARLEHSSAMLGIKWPGRKVIEQDIHMLMSAHGSLRLRIIVSETSFGDAAGGFSYAVTGTELILPKPGLYREGAAVVTRPGVISLIPGCKSTSYANSRWLTRVAHAEGAHECILYESEDVREGATSNVFVVADGEVWTPDAHHILPGITRGRIIELAEELGVLVHVGTLKRETLARADEVWLTSAIRGLMPVGQVDGRSLGGPGPVYRSLRARYESDLTAALV